MQADCKASKLGSTFGEVAWGGSTPSASSPNHLILLTAKGVDMQDDQVCQPCSPGRSAGGCTCATGCSNLLLLRVGVDSIADHAANLAMHGDLLKALLQALLTYSLSNPKPPSNHWRRR